MADYEKQRQAQIARNKSRMSALGILDAKAALAEATSAAAPPTNRKRKRDDDGDGGEAPPPKRQLPPPRAKSSRLSAVAAGVAISDVIAAQVPSSISGRKSIIRGHNGVRRVGIFIEEVSDDEDGSDPAEPPIVVVGGSVVTALGAIVTGPNILRYWSERASMWVHPYPVGYAAMKEQWGHTFYMRIEEGPKFIVEMETGVKFTHATPSGAWEAVLKHLKGETTKHRVSGPLYFGFSDSIIQRKLLALPGCKESIQAYKEATE